MADWYYLDPDNRKDEPKTIFCARCLRPIKQTQAFESFQRIVIHPDNPWFRLADLRERESGMIGSKCFEKVKKEYGIVYTD